jgi:hypothetical protein
MTNDMRKICQRLCSISMCAAFFGLMLTAGCAPRVRYYDPYYHDYHYWNHDEVVYYQQWEHETHRQHVDFKNRSQAEQSEYWKWRHSHDH